MSEPFDARPASFESKYHKDVKDEFTSLVEEIQDEIAATPGFKIEPAFDESLQDSNSPDIPSIPQIKSEPSSHDNDSEELQDLYVTYLPLNWSQKQIKTFIEKECGTVKKINIVTDSGTEFTGTLRLEFEDKEQCVKAKEALNGKEVEGLRIHALCVKREADKEEELDNTDDTDSPEPPRKKFKSENNGLESRNDQEDSSDGGLYGLKPEFLKSLDITPPLTKWVHINNFRCDKWDLKEALELAGRVMVCKVTHGAKKFARVMFSHPLEAVQAISMLHNQLFFGIPLHISMENLPPNFALMPNGLPSIGPGLGQSGQALPDIAKQYEQHIKGTNSALNKTIFHTKEQIQERKGQNRTQNSNDRIVSGPLEIPLSFASSIMNRNRDKVSPIPTLGHRQSISPVAKPHTNPTMAAPPRPYFPTFQNQLVPVGQRPQMAQMPVVRPQLANIPRHGPSNIRPGPSMVHGGNVRPFGPSSVNLLRPPMVPVQPDPVSVQLNNLPLSTSFPQLSEKMAAVGPVMCLQLTGPGCALIKFSHRSYAEKCFQMYNNVNIMGNIVTARMV